MSQLKDFMDNDLQPGKLYTYTYYRKSGGYTQVLLMFKNYTKSRANFIELVWSFSNNVNRIKYSGVNECFLMSKPLIRITPDMLPADINKAISDWFYQYTTDKQVTNISNEWWSNT